MGESLLIVTGAGNKTGCIPNTKVGKIASVIRNWTGVVLFVNDHKGTTLIPEIQDAKTAFVFETEDRMSESGSGGRCRCITVTRDDASSLAVADVVMNGFQPSRVLVASFGEEALFARIKEVWPDTDVQMIDLE